jgi:hypothetical protein
MRNSGNPRGGIEVVLCARRHLFVRPRLDVLGSIVHASCPGGQGNLLSTDLVYHFTYLQI